MESFSILAVMRKSEVLLVGPLPPPSNGQSAAFEMLVDSFVDRSKAHRIVDLSQGSRTSATGGLFTVGRLIEYARICIYALPAVFCGRGPIYLAVAQSWRGFLRDAYFIWLGWACGRRITIHVHGGNYGRFFEDLDVVRQLLVRATLRRVTNVIVLSDRLRGMLDFDYKMSDKIHVVPNAISKELSTASVNPAAKERHSTFRILYLSNMIESKGYLDLLMACDELLNRRNIASFNVVFAGQFIATDDDSSAKSSAEALEEFERFVEDRGLSACTRYIGTVAGEAKRSVLKESDVFVLPTSYNNEGQPISILEAMWFGLPVVTTEYRAIPDMVIDGETGIFVRRNEPNTIADALEMLMWDSDLYSSLSRKAMSHVREKFTYDKHVASIHDVIG